MGAPSRVEALQPGAIRWAGSPRERLTVLKVLCSVQILMVVANLGRIPVLSTDERDFPLAFNEICLGTMLLVALYGVSSWRAIRLDRISITALLFALIGGGSAVWSVQRFDLNALELFISLAFLGRWLMYFALYVAVINVVKVSEVDRMWSAVETMLVVFALFGIVQSAFLPGFTQMIYHDNRSFNWDQQGHRLVSTVLEPNIAGTMLMIGVLVQLSRVAAGAQVSRWKLLVLFTGLVLTLSRSAAIGFVVGLAVILAARGLSRRLVRIGLGIGALFVLTSPLILRYAILYNKFAIGVGTSAWLRFANWLNALQIIVDHPIFGIGFNTYRYALDHYGLEVVGASSYGVDGGLLFILTMTGVVGLTVYCFMLWQIVMHCRSVWRDPGAAPNQHGIAIGTASATLAIVVASAFVNSLLTTFVMEMLWVLWGLTFIIVRSRGASAAPAAPLTSTRLVAVVA